MTGKHEGWTEGQRHITLSGNVMSGNMAVHLNDAESKSSFFYGNK